MQAKFIHGLLQVAEQYETEGGNTAEFDREDFMSWLLVQAGQSQASLLPMDAIPTVPEINGLIAMHFGFMANYAVYYSRRVFRESVIYSMDDWGILVSLFPYTQMKKSDALRRCAMEKSSGNEVLKRLLKQGLIAESPHPNDQRSKLIALTEAGRAAFLSVDAAMSNLSQQVVADLTETEKTDLLRILFKLQRFHQAVFEAADETALRQILMTND
jgi:MarR family transcriptional regulator, lower aerobic nicotinate degradation pathway regulator